MPFLYQDADKFIKDIFWTETHNKVNTLNIPEIINAKLIEDNKNKDPEYYAHREGVVHVSSLSRCLRGVMLEMLGAQKDVPPDPRKLGVFKAGNLFEEFIVNCLGDLMQDRQTEYNYKYKNLILTGRDDGTILHNGVRTLLEAKSVHSQSFWYREKEGTLVASHNQMQIQTYLWLRRELFNDPIDGIFSYISKDDCTVICAPIKYNPRIIEEVVKPALDILSEAYEKKSAVGIPMPSSVVFDDSRDQYQKNWMATYCEFHQQCCGAGWILEAEAEVTRKNKEHKNVMQNYAHLNKKEKPVITTEPLPKVDG